MFKGRKYNGEKLRDIIPNSFDIVKFQRRVLSGKERLSPREREPYNFMREGTSSWIKTFTTPGMLKMLTVNFECAYFIINFSKDDCKKTRKPAADSKRER